MIPHNTNSTPLHGVFTQNITTQQQSFTSHKHSLAVWDDVVQCQARLDVFRMAGPALRKRHPGQPHTSYNAVYLTATMCVHTALEANMAVYQ